MAIAQTRTRPGLAQGGSGLVLLGLLLSIGPAAPARVDQEFYPTRHAATLAARKMGGPTAILYDSFTGKYVVTLLERPPTRHARRHHR